MAQDEKPSLFEKMDLKLAWAFHPWLFGWIAGVFASGLVFGYLAGSKQSAGTAIAILGAFVACCGLITLGRPMIRMGGYKEWFKQSQITNGGGFEPAEEEKAEEEEQKKDALSVQIVGPSLAIVGTMVNGLSGLFG